LRPGGVGAVSAEASRPTPPGLGSEAIAGAGRPGLRYRPALQLRGATPRPESMRAAAAPGRGPAPRRQRVPMEDQMSDREKRVERTEHGFEVRAAPPEGGQVDPGDAAA